MNGNCEDGEDEIGLWLDKAGCWIKSGSRRRQTRTLRSSFTPATELVPSKIFADSRWSELIRVNDTG